MGRIISPSPSVTASPAGLALLPSYPGQMSSFGQGRCVVFYFDGETFNVPADGDYRIRVLGGGGGMSNAGQTSSFGALISATGGAEPVGALGGEGGHGIGGDFQASGGAGGDAELTRNCGGGGGGAGSQLGDGGRGGDGNYYASGPLESSGTVIRDFPGGGGGVGGHAGGKATYDGPAGGGSPFGAADGWRPGPNYQGHTGHSSGVVLVDGLAPPYFFFVGGSDIASATAELSGQGGRGAMSANTVGGSGYTLEGRAGGVGGGGGGSHLRSQGYGSRFGGGVGGGSGRGGAGGGGYAHGVFSLHVGETYPVAVAQSVGELGSTPGLVIVEW